MKALVELENGLRTYLKMDKVIVLINLQTGDEIEFSSGRQASLWLGLCEDAVVKAIKKGHLLKDKQFKAYRK